MSEVKKARGRRSTLFWEAIMGLSVVAILVGVPILLYWYNSAVATAQTPGEVVFNVLGRNDNLIEKQGYWLVQRGGGWDYENKDAPDVIRVRQGDRVVLRLSSMDTVHGFLLPEYRINESIYPGKVTTITFAADKVGEFTFYCSIYCGHGHGFMTGKLIVEPR